MVDAIFHSGRIRTLDEANPEADAVAIADGKFASVGDARSVLALAGPHTKIVDLKGKRVVPGLNDSHTHLVRGGLNYNMELRWDGLGSLGEALEMLKAQVAVTPPPQWVRVVGGFSEHQFAEKRLPTLDELNAIAPDTPVFILHLYDRALLNGAALRAAGYTKETQAPPGCEIARDAHGEPTGLLVAKPNALILYATLAKGPKLDPADQIVSTRLFMRELNRLGITSVIDAGGGFQNYPDDYAVVRQLADAGELTVRIAYNLFTQNKGAELQDFQRWTKIVSPGDGTPMFRHNGAGEMLVFSAADFEDFKEPRPDLPPSLENDLEGVVRHLAAHRWPFRIHGTYEESIARFLDVFEKVDRDVPFDGLHFIVDHAETVSPRSIERIAKLGGGIAIQHRMAYQGEDFVARYGAKAAAATPPVKRMLAAGVPVGGGTDATRVASYNPWVALSWLTTGRTVGGLRVTPEENCLDRETALRLWTQGSAWFSSEDGAKGQIKIGQHADMIALSADYFSVPAAEISHLASDLTVVGGRIVHADGDFKLLAPPDLPVSPAWSPVKRFGGYQHRRPGEARFVATKIDRRGAIARAVDALCGCASACGIHGHAHGRTASAPVAAGDLKPFWGALGCSCFF